MSEFSSESSRNVLIYDKYILNHRIHLAVSEKNGKIITKNLLQRIALLMIADRVILYLK